MSVAKQTPGCCSFFSSLFTDLTWVKSQTYEVVFFITILLFALYYGTVINHQGRKGEYVKARKGVVEAAAATPLISFPLSWP